MNNRYSIKNVINSFNYKLVSTYKNSYTKIHLICPNKHDYFVTWSNFNSGCRCPICRKENIFNEIKKYLSKINYKYIDIKKYKNAETKLELICNKGHSFSQSWHSLQKGHLCQACTKENMSIKKRITIEEIKSSFENIKNYQLLEFDFNNGCTYVKVQCEKGHIWITSFTRWKRGHRCIRCQTSHPKEKHPLWKGGVTIKNIPLFTTFNSQISWCEETRRDPEDGNILNVKCTYCGKWYRPKKSNIYSRIASLNGMNEGESRLYCSEECKQLCPIYDKKKYSSEETNTKQFSREVQPQLRQMVFKRDNWTCIKCSNTSNLQCHHLEGVRWEPLESADIDKCVTLCKNCHEKVHEIEGCKPFEMRCD